MRGNISATNRANYQRIQSEFIGLSDPYNSPFARPELKKLLPSHDQHLSEAELKKYFVLLAKIIADHFRFIRLFKPHTKKTSLAQSQASDAETILAMALADLKNLGVNLDPAQLMSEDFYDPTKNKTINLTDAERDEILVAELQIQCAVAKNLAEDEYKTAIETISTPQGNNQGRESQFPQSKRFTQHAVQNYISHPEPLMECLQKTIIENVGKVTGKNAQYEIVDNLNTTDIINNGNKLLAKKFNSHFIGFQSAFSSLLGSIKTNDAGLINAAASQFRSLEAENKPKVAASIRVALKNISWQTRYFTRAVRKLQESLELLVKTYLKAEHLTKNNLSELAGIFFEMPFSNKNWWATFELLRKNFQKLDYLEQLKVISALVTHEEKKKESNPAIADLILQAWAFNQGQYETPSELRPGDAQTSLKVLNYKHFQLICANENELDPYLKDLTQFFNFKDGASSINKVPTEQQEAIDLLDAAGNLCDNNLHTIQTAKASLNQEVNTELNRLHIEHDQNDSLEIRMQKLEGKLKALENDGVKTADLGILQELIARGKITLDLERKRAHIQKNPSTKEFYSDFLRGSTITLEGYRTVASDKVGRRHKPTLYASNVLGWISSFLSMPVVSGALTLAADGIETAGSFKLHYNSVAISKITTTNSKLEYLVEQMAIMLALHMEEDLKHLDPDSAKKLAHYCQQRFVSLILTHVAENDWEDLDQAARKYVSLITQELKTEDSLLEKAKEFFHHIKSLAMFRLKTNSKDVLRKTIAEVVSKPFNAEEYDKKHGLDKATEYTAPRAEAPIQAPISYVNGRILQLETSIAELKADNKKLKAEVTQLVSDAENQRVKKARKKVEEEKKKLKELDSTNVEASDIFIAPAPPKSPPQTPAVRRQEQEIRVLESQIKLAKKESDSVRPHTSSVRNLEIDFSDTSDSETQTTISAPKASKTPSQDPLVRAITQFNELLIKERNFCNDLLILSNNFNSKEKPFSETRETLLSTMEEEEYKSIVTAMEFIKNLSINLFGSLKIIGAEKEADAKTFIQANKETALNSFIEQMGVLRTIITSAEMTQKCSAFMNIVANQFQTSNIVAKHQGSFNAFVKGYSSTYLFRDILIKPVQQVPRYIMILEEMQKAFKKLEHDGQGTYNKEDILGHMEIAEKYYRGVAKISNAFTPQNGYEIVPMASTTTLPEGLKEITTEVESPIGESKTVDLKYQRKLEVGKIYVEAIYNEEALASLKYTLIDQYGVRRSGLITEKDLPKLEGRLNAPFDVTNIKPFLKDILQVTEKLQYTNIQRIVNNVAGLFASTPKETRLNSFVALTTDAPQKDTNAESESVINNNNKG